jgi:hypothetical protein
MPTASRTLTTVEAARVLGVSVRRLRQLKERIGYGRHGRQLAFRLADVRRFKRNRGSA